MGAQTQEIELKITADKLHDTVYIEKQLRAKAKAKTADQLRYKLIKRSIDARKGRPKYVMRYLVSLRHQPQTDADKLRVSFQNVKEKQQVIIVGAGPAGYFAALECLELGMCPIILERGKDVRARRRDLKAIQQDGVVNPDSNYCFGEGGAGTYSDGKLYTRSKKRGHILKTLRLLVDHGAQEDILVDAHPHIGSNKLPQIISRIRETIEKHGGEVHFETKVVDFLMASGSCEGVVTASGKHWKAPAVILATGHSARDIFELLYDKGVYIEAKPFAVGVRVEHPQQLIDEIQYKQSPREQNLPASSYSLVTQVQDVGVFSFCMCPGGLIVPAATAPGEIVVNGMSLSRRDSAYANSGIVTAVSVEELEKEGYDGVFSCLDFQRDVEQSLFENGDGSQRAPAQNLVDFVNGADMLDLPDTSYIPGIYRAPLHEMLPPFIYARLREGLVAFSRRMKGFYSDEAKVVAVESRTSSPVRIPRDRETCVHTEVNGLYPCGEGAGYAGGILSAAMDGQRVAKAVYEKIK
jgi:uncharacterized FAD-dependent dehydrogenase